MEMGVVTRLSASVPWKLEKGARCRDLGVSRRVLGFVGDQCVKPESQSSRRSSWSQSQRMRGCVREKVKRMVISVVARSQVRLSGSERKIKCRLDDSIV
jgi:hypothetical protein